jgi:hypothetical protein
MNGVKSDKEKIEFTKEKVHYFTWVNSYSFDNLSCVALTCKGSESNLQ